MRFILAALLLIASWVASSARGDDLKRQAPVAGPGDKALAAYFEAEVSAIEKTTLAGVRSVTSRNKRFISAKFR